MPRRLPRAGSNSAGTLEALESRRLLAGAPITFGAAINDGIYAVETLPDNSTLVAGTFGGTTDFQPGSGVTVLTSRGQSDVFIARYSTRGKLLWVGQIGGAGGRVDSDPLYSPVTATIGEFENRTGPSANKQGEYVTTLKVRGDVLYIAGSFQATANFDTRPGAEFNRRSDGYHDAFIAAYRVADGSLVNAFSFGGPFDDVVKDLAFTSNGDLIATGQFTRQADFNPLSAVTSRQADGRDDIFVARYTPEGRLTWVYTAGGDAIRLDERDSGEGVAVDANDNVYVTGSFAGRADWDPSPAKFRVEAIDKTDAFLLRLSPRGKLDYIKPFGGEGYDGGRNIAIDAQNRLYISGYFSETANLDPGAGRISLVAREEGDSRDTDDDDQGIDEFDLFLGQYSLTGDAAWVRQIGGDDYELLGQMRLADDGSVLVSGSFAGRIEFYGARSAAALRSVAGDDDFDDDSNRDDSYDAFVVRYSPRGGFVSAVKVGGNGDDWGNALGFNASSGQLAFAGIFRNTANFGLDGGSPRVRSNGLQDAFLLGLELDADLA